MPVTSAVFTGGSSGDISNAANFTLDPKLSNIQGLVDFPGTPYTHAPSSCSTTAEWPNDLQIDNGLGADLSFFSKISLDGNLDFENCAKLSLASVPASITSGGGNSTILTLGEWINGGDIDVNDATVFIVATLDDETEYDVDSVSAIYGADSSTGISGGSATLLAFFGSTSAKVSHSSPPGSMSTNHCAVNLLASVLPNSVSLSRLGSGGFTNYSMDAGNSYAALTGGSGQTKAIGNTISGTYDPTTITPTSLTVAGTACTSFSATAGAWSATIASGTATGAGKAVRLLSSSQTADIGVDTLTVTGSAAAGESLMKIGRGISFGTQIGLHAGGNISF